MRNAENWPECFTLSLPVMCIVFSFSHFGIQVADSWFDKLPSFRIFDTACFYLRHAVQRDVLVLSLNTNLRSLLPPDRSRKLRSVTPRGRRRSPSPPAMARWTGDEAGLALDPGAGVVAVVLSSSETVLYILRPMLVTWGRPPDSNPNPEFLYRLLPIKPFRFRNIEEYKSIWI